MLHSSGSLLPEFTIYISTLGPIVLYSRNLGYYLYYLQPLLDTIFTYILSPESRRVIRTSEAMEPDDPYQPAGLGDDSKLDGLASVAAAAYQLYQETTALECLQQAISGYEQCLTAVPRDAIRRLPFEFGLARCLGSRYDRFENPSDLRRKIEYCEQIVAATPQDRPNWGQYVAQLAAGLAERYYDTEEIDDLERAILYSKEVIASAAVDDPKFVQYLSVMASLLYCRYEKFTDMSDHQQSILYCREVVVAAPHNHPERARYLSGMATALLRLYYVTEEIEDLQQSIVYSEEAVEATHLDHHGRAGYLSELSGILLYRYEVRGDANDFRLAMLYAEEAKALLPVDGPDRVNNLVLLARFSSERYRLSKDPRDIQQAISYQERAIKAMKNHARRGYIISQLVQFLTNRYQRIGDIEDLHHAIPYAREALRETLPGRTRRPDRLIDLAFLLGRRFERMRDADDIHQAILYCKEAVAATPQHGHDRVNQIHNLSGLLVARYQRMHDISDVYQIILVTEAEITETPQGKAVALPLLASLSTALILKYQHAADINDLNQAILYAEAVVKGRPEGHPQRGRAFFQLASAKWHHFTTLIAQGESFDRTTWDDIATEIETVSDLFRKVWECSSLYPRMRVFAVTLVASLLVFEQGMTSTSPAGDGTPVLSKIVYDMKLASISCLIEQAVRLLPTIVQRTLGRGEQEHSLRSFGNLASFGASWGLETGNTPYDVLKLLELSRGIIIGFDIDCRGELSNLQETYPAIAATLRDLRQMVDTPSLDREPTGIRRVESSFDQEMAYYTDRIQAQQKRETDISKMDDVLAEIRTLPSYERFQLPPSAEELMAMAKDGPIVTFISSDARSDSIIITSSSITTLPLPDMVYDEIPDWFQSRVKPPSRKSGKARKSKWHLMMEYKERNERMREQLLWLWSVAVEPVLRELKFTDPVDIALPHIWWIGVGRLSMAPFHAAGDHSLNSSRNTISCVISSYTSTLKALSYSRERELELADAHLLLISMTKTPGERDLPDVEKEISGILEVTEGLISTEHLRSPSVGLVLDRLATSAILHFACHGVSDTKISSNSHLMLLDSSGTKADKLTVQDISQNNTRSSQLAYLSACSTAQNSVATMADQTIHIASGFQLAGFSHVLATLFPSETEVCKELAIDFYRSLFNGQNRDVGHRKVSMAFHEAVKNARDKSPLLPSKWAPFIHLGA